MNRFAVVFALISLIALGACGGSDEVTGPTSIEIQEITVGTGATAAVGDVVTVNYVGMFPDGRVFDPGAQPLTFVVGALQLIPGFEQGVVGRPQARAWVFMVARMKVLACSAAGSSGSSLTPAMPRMRSSFEPTISQASAGTVPAGKSRGSTMKPPPELATAATRSSSSSATRVAKALPFENPLT